jgi:hypothetical protein
MTGKGTAIIDWLSFTWEGWSDCQVDQMVRKWLREWLKEPLAGESGNGLYGFENSVTFYSFDKSLDEVPVAILAWGGERQRGRCYLSINGTGSAFSASWNPSKPVSPALTLQLMTCPVI